MEFRSQLYSDYEEKYLTPRFYVMLSILLLIIVLYYFEITGYLRLFILVYMFIGGVYIFLRIMLSFFLLEDHTKKHEGEIIINKDHISWNTEYIDWNTITDFKITSYSIEYSPINLNHELMNKQDSGIDNELYIKLKDGTEYKANYKIKSIEHGDKLMNILFEAIVHNHISYPVAVKMLNPADYKEHQFLKEYCRRYSGNKEVD